MNFFFTTKQWKKIPIKIELNKLEIELKQNKKPNKCENSIKIKIIK